MVRRAKPEPKPGDWRGHVSPNSKVCKSIICPKCGMMGCWTWWVDYTNKDAHGRPVFRVIAVLHSHYLRDTFEPRRNHNCVLKDTKTRLRDNEGVWSFRLKHPDSIPWHISDQF